MIFENKIYDATDQESQLYRYIKATKEHGFDNDDIYVFYLTKYGDEPSEQTWGDDKTKLLFAPRFMQLSFREDILQWLKNDILPFIRQKDNYLLCAISQYVDYLEGIFSLRNIHKSLNMNIQKIISDKLGLSAINDLRERYEKIQETLDDLDTLQNSLIGIKEQVYQELIQQYVSDWKSSFIPPSEKFQISDYDGWDESILFGVKFMCDDKPTHVVIGFENNNNGLFCQVERDLTLRKELLNEDTLSIYTLAKSYLKLSNNNYIYQYFGQDFQAVFNKFRELVKAIDIAI